MAEKTEQVTTEPEDDNVEIVLVSAETNLPFDTDDDPIIIPGSEFRFLVKKAADKGMTFEEYFVYIIRLAIENFALADDFKKADFELEKFEDLK